jgi:hypothetical protein
MAQEKRTSRLGIKGPQVMKKGPVSPLPQPKDNPMARSGGTLIRVGTKGSTS